MDKADARSGQAGGPEAVDDSETLPRALALARASHAGQLRKDGAPYVEHPISVAETLADAEFGEEIRAAALLHDAVEDADIDLESIRRDFGDRVATLVAAMTDDRAVDDYVERKRTLRDAVEAAGPDAVAIFAADKLANLRVVRAAYAQRGEEIASTFEVPLDERIAIWHQDLEMVAAAAPGLPYLRDLRYELESFEEERAAQDGLA